MKRVVFAKCMMVLCLLMALIPQNSQAQETQKEKEKKKPKQHEFYFSWGYNKDWFSKSNITVDQPSLNSHYTFQSISGHDHPGWDEGILSKGLTIPQYNYRIGIILNKEKGWGMEVNFDHTKFIFTDGEHAHIK